MLVHFTMGVLLSDPYPVIPGYILDLEHSNLLVKLFVNKSHCKLISKNDCKKINHYDIQDACYKYLCFNFLTVRSVAPRKPKTSNLLG